jgi:N utilization substance protein A
MILIENFSQVIAQIESERGLDKAVIIDAIEKSLISAAKKKYGIDLNVKAYVNEDSGEARLWMEKSVVDSYTDQINELLLSEAQELSDDVAVGDVLEIDIDVEEFGRIAAQTAKQIILQCMREAEKDLIFSEFSDKIGDIVTGTIQNIEGNTYLVNLGKVEAFLMPREQTPGENFNVKDRIRVFVVDIQKTSRGPIIKISRSHSGLIRKLFYLEVPEIQDGIITIKSISRDPGRRTKIAVSSNNQTVGAVGTCVGHMGGRIQAILREINNEKIDILEWNEDPKIFIGNSLKPATISKVIINNQAAKEAAVVVPDDQLSLAIGKFGQNVRLAVKLTGWKLDIMSDSDYKKLNAVEKPDESQSLADKIKASTAMDPNEDSVESSPPDVDASDKMASEAVSVESEVLEPTLPTESDNDHIEPGQDRDLADVELLSEALDSEES